MYEQPYGAEKRQARRIFNRLGLGLFLLLALPVVISAIILAVLAVVDPSIMQHSWFTLVFNYLPLYCVGLPAFLLVMKPIPDSPLPAPPEPKAGISFGVMLRLTCVCTAIMVICSYLSEFLALLLEAALGQRADNMLETTLESSLTGNGFDLLFTLLILVIVAPVVEELIFRWVTYKKLIRYGGKVYILLTASLFALFHMNIYQLFYAFGIGLVLGAVVYFTGNWYYSIILHMLVNFLGSAPTLLLVAAGKGELLLVWGGVRLLIALFGVIFGADWLLKKRHHKLRIQPAQVLLPRGTMLANLGMPLALLVMLVVLVLFTIFI